MQCWAITSQHMMDQRTCETSICHPSMSLRKEKKRKEKKRKEKKRKEKKRKEKTTPFGVNSMRSQILYRAAQGLRGIKVD